MTTPKLSALVDVTRAQYEVVRNQCQPFLDAETRIRADLTQLARHEREAQANTEDLARMRPFGGDVLWTAWIGRQRRMLNMELARVLAEKEEILKQLRRAYGRVAVSQAMHDKQSKAQQQERNKKSAQALFENFLRSSLDKP